jgi:uncharacterized protein (DUF4415 family)
MASSFKKHFVFVINVKRGRPLGSGQKTQVTLRIDTDVLNKFKATGAGWQRRINDALKTVKI